MKCPACRVEIADNARRCPHCTSVIEHITQKGVGKGTVWSAIKGFFGGIVLTLILLLAVWGFGGPDVAVAATFLAGIFLIIPGSTFWAYKYGYTKQYVRPRR